MKQIGPLTPQQQQQTFGLRNFHHHHDTLDKSKAIYNGAKIFLEKIGQNLMHWLVTHVIASDFTVNYFCYTGVMCIVYALSSNSAKYSATMQSAVGSCENFG